MVDTWATVGSCAQIGKNVHLSGGAGIGGVLEPLQAGPVIIEDDCFIGARSEVVEGVVVERGAVLSMGVYRFHDPSQRRDIVGIDAVVEIVVYCGGPFLSLVVGRLAVFGGVNRKATTIGSGALALHQSVSLHTTDQV